MQQDVHVDRPGRTHQRAHQGDRGHVGHVVLLLQLLQLQLQLQLQLLLLLLIIMIIVVVVVVVVVIVVVTLIIIVVHKGPALRLQRRAARLAVPLHVGAHDDAPIIKLYYIIYHNISISCHIISYHVMLYHIILYYITL